MKASEFINEGGADKLAPGDNPMVLPFKPVPMPDPESGNPDRWTPTPDKFLSTISPTMRGLNVAGQAAVKGLRKKIHDTYPKLQQDPICPPGHTGVELEEKWTQKYKSSINCSNPKGFSQKAHCAGKKK